MEYRTFGSTEMKVSVLGFGGSEIGFLGADFSEVETGLNAALDAGLNVIDTAECYVDSEAQIGRAVGHRRDDFFLFTKCGHRFQGGPELPDWSPALLEASLDHSLKALRTHCVDLLQLHSCSREVLERGEVVEFVQRAKASGKTRFIGYSGDSQNAVYALGLGVFDAFQTSVNIADQECIDLTLPLAEGLGVIAKRPVANVSWQKWPEMPDRQYGREYWERLRELNYDFLSSPLAESFEIALRFTLAQSVSTMIVGTTKPSRWAQNAAIIAKGPLPADQVEAIRARWNEVAHPDWIGQT